MGLAALLRLVLSQSEAGLNSRSSKATVDANVHMSMNQADAPPHARNLRKGRVSLEGQVYLITAVTRDRQPIFSRFSAARLVIRALREEQRLGRADTLAFVVMPDHLHWLMQLRPGAHLSGVVRAVKSVSAHELGQHAWQRGFHDHALRAEEDIRGVARYVVSNPLRAGLVDRLGDYPHWDAIWL